MSFFDAWWGTFPSTKTETTNAALPQPTAKRTAGTLKLGTAREIAPTTTVVQETILVRVKVRETAPVGPPEADKPKKPTLTTKQQKELKRAKADASRERSLHKGPASSMLMRRGIMIAAISGRKQHEVRA